MQKKRSLAEGFLQRLCDDNVPVSIFLVNGIKLQGHLDSFDEQVIVLKDSIQLIFKHAVSTIVPLTTF